MNMRLWRRKTGEKAIEIMKEGRFGFSIVLPGYHDAKTGRFWGFTRDAGANRWLKELPVIIISAETSNEYIRTGV